MLKFFRRLRQNLPAENRLGRYLLYAAGEIILVVIGILLALQINNWNEHRKDLRKEQLILQNLKENLEFNLEELVQTMESTREGYMASFQLLELIEPEPTVDVTQKADSLLAVIEGYYTYDPATGVMDEIINSGQLNSIQNQELKNQISKWSRMLTDTQKNMDIANDHLYQVLLVYLMEEVNFRNIPRQVHLFEKTQLPRIPPSNFKAGYKMLLTSLKFENLVNQHAWNLMWIINEYMNIQTYLKTTIDLLEKEIQPTGSDK